LTLVYDNTDGFETGFAVANLGLVSTSMTISVLDQNGVRLGSSQTTLTAWSHKSMFVDQLFPQSANQRGIVQIQGVALTGIGLRFNPTGSFTSVPVLP
jgi:hypothetical protein